MRLKIMTITFLFVYLHLLSFGQAGSVPINKPVAKKVEKLQNLENGTIYRVIVNNEDSADYAEYTMFLPEKTDTIRGVFVHQHGCGMEGRGKASAYDVQYQAFAKKWGLVIVGPDLYYQSGCEDWRDPESGSGSSLLTALEQLGIASTHLELKDAPWLLWGHSGGGYWTLAMMRDYPERILAAFCYSPAFDPTWDYPKAALQIPLMIRHAGPGDANATGVECWQTAINTFDKLRASGGQVSIAYTPYQSHNYSFVRHMAIPFYESILANRLPTGQIISYRGMENIGPGSTWLGDSKNLNTFRSSTYTQDPLKLSWFSDSLTASKWKEYVITGNVIDRTPPPEPYSLIYKRLHNQAVELGWKAEADIESGIKHFNIYKDNVKIAQFPEHGYYQHFDTNGDDALPFSGVPELKTIVTISLNDTSTVSISTVNHFNLESTRKTFTAID